MDPKWKTALKDSISEVFSTMFFMVPEENPDLAQSSQSVGLAGWYQGSMQISQPSALVVVTVWTPAQVARELSANMLTGGAEELGEAEVLDCFGEMINMVAGGVLTKVDQLGQWKMGLPQKQILASGNLAGLVAGQGHCEFLEVEAMPLVAAISQRSV